MDKTNYSTNLTEKQYEVIKNFLETKIGRLKHLLKEIINAMFYPVKTDCKWRLLLNDFPKWIITVNGKRLYTGRNKRNIAQQITEVSRQIKVSDLRNNRQSEHKNDKCMRRKNRF
ncbi:MAG: transposase [Prevotellaceae bacterium]|nr:transposase [Prevotellaceae bacterium]